MALKPKYMLFSAPQIPNKIKWKCDDCEDEWYTDENVTEPTCNKCESKNTIITNPLIMSGLFCWISAFRDNGCKAVMRATTAKSILEDYDIIHVNLTPGHSTYTAAIREALGESSDTKLVVNVDYASSMWGNVDPLMLKKELSNADMIFHVESTGAARLSRLLGTQIPTLPHPVDTTRIKKLRKIQDWPPKVTCQYHRYWGTWVPYYYATKKLREQGLRTTICNVSGNLPPLISFETLFDEVLGNMQYVNFMKDVMAPAFANLDVAPDRTYGRGIVDAAALEIPTISSKTIEAARRIFPELIVDDHEDDKTMEELLEKVLTDTESTERVVREGSEKCEYYNTKNSYKRMITELETRRLI